MSGNSKQTQALDMLDNFLRRIPNMDEPPFDEVIELALAADLPQEWLGILNGQMVNVNLKLIFLSLAMGQCSMSVTGDSITIVKEHGPGAGNVTETGPCPWYMVVEPLNKWLESHPEWMSAG